MNKLLLAFAVNASLLVVFVLYIIFNGIYIVSEAISNNIYK